MTGTFKKAAVAGAVALAFSASAFAVPITNGIVSADVNASGTFASLSYLGNEFVAWGTPMSYYWLTSSAGTAVANNASSTNPLGATTFGGGTFTFTSNSGGLVFNETVSLIGNKAVVGVSLKTR